MLSKKAEQEVTLWDIDHANLKDRIEARRGRISRRLEAAKKLTTMIKVQNMFEDGLHSNGDEEEEEDPKGRFVEVGYFSNCPSWRNRLN